MQGFNNMDKFQKAVAVVLALSGLTSIAFSDSGKSAQCDGCNWDS